MAYVHAIIDSVATYTLCTVMHYCSYVSTAFCILDAQVIFIRTIKESIICKQTQAVNESVSVIVIVI